MKRKALIISIIAVIISLFSISYTFAANDKIGNMANGIRNAVGGAENVVEGVGNSVGRAVQSGMNTVGNGARNVGNATRNTIDNAGKATQNTVGAVTNNNNDGYTATRTNANLRTTNAETGMFSATPYVWFIIAATAIAIGVLLWSYFRQNKRNNLYIDSDDDK